MDTNNLSKIAVAIGAIAIIISSASLIITVTDSEDKDDIKYTMYVGLGSVNRDVVHDFITGIIVSEYESGYTSFDAEGGYYDGSGVITNETIVYIINGIDGIKVYDLADRIKSEYGLAVMVEEQYAKASLV